MKNWQIKALSKDIRDALDNANKDPIPDGNLFYSFMNQKVKMFIGAWKWFKENRY